MRGKAGRFVCFIAVVSFVILTAAAPGWCAMTGKWKVTRTTTADVTVTGLPSEHQVQTQNQTWTFAKGKIFAISDGTGGTWTQTGTKFTADMKKALAATWVAIMKSKGLTGTAKVVAAKYAFKGTEKDKTHMSGTLNYEVLLTITAPISTSGKAVVKSIFSGTRIVSSSVETESDVLNALLDGFSEM